MNTNWTPDLELLIQKLESIFRGLNENTIRGHITVELLRKIYSTRESFLKGWINLGCDLAVPGYVENLESEIQNSLMTVKNAIKVRIFEFCGSLL